MKFLSRTYSAGWVALISVVAFVVSRECFVALPMYHFRLSPMFGEWPEYVIFGFSVILLIFSVFLWMWARLDLWLRILITVICLLVLPVIHIVFTALFGSLLGGLMF